MKQFELTDMNDYRLIPQLVERMNEQMRIEGEKFIYERLMDLQIDKDILLNQMQEICRLNGILHEFKDKQEQGLIPILMPNDIVWDIDYGRPKAWRITAFSFGSSDYIDAPDYKNEMVYYYENIGRTIQGSFPSSEIGTEIFLTEAEAEEALERMKGE